MGDIQLEKIKQQTLKIKEQLTQQLLKRVVQTNATAKSVKQLQKQIALKDQIIEHMRFEIKTLQEAFEYLLNDWIEELEKRGISADQILKQRTIFNKVIYWKH